jgi:hypothetical protein
MFYIGGVVTGMGKVNFTCCDGDLAWVVKNTQQAWLGARGEDRDATYFVAPLASSGGQVPVLDLAVLEEGLKGGCRGC